MRLPVVRPRAVRAVLLATVLLSPVLPSPVPDASAAAPDPRTTAGIAAQVRQLDRDVHRASDELARAAAAYEAAEALLARRTTEGFDAREDAEARRAATSASRSSRDGLARAAYKGGVPAIVTALLSGDPRLLSDLARVQRVVDAAGAGRRDVLAAAQDEQAQAERALRRSDADRRDAVALRRSTDVQLRALDRRTQQLTARLFATADRLAQARAADRARLERARVERLRAAARRAGTAPPPLPQVFPSGPLPVGLVRSGGGSCQPPSPYGEANGFLSDEGLCPLAVGGGHRLRTDAARAYDLLDAAHRAAIGTPLCITDSYRSFAAQVDVFRRKPGLAATPGRSNHGWGRAVDLCGGIQTFGTPEHEWMQRNAPAFGWVHPRWAEPGGSRPEAWHWEYAGA